MSASLFKGLTAREGLAAIRAAARRIEAAPSADLTDEREYALLVEVLKYIGSGRCPDPEAYARAALKARPSYGFAQRNAVSPDYYFGSDNFIDETLRIPVTGAQKGTISRAAEATGQDFAAWARLVLLAEAGKVLGEEG